TDEFCARENITCLNMEIYYSWDESDLRNAMVELGIATVYQDSKNLAMTTPFIEEIMKCDLILDFSGEMWGDHAEPVGENRFLVNLIKDRVAQLLGKPVVLLAGSQGPFVKTEKVVEFARLVFKNFSLAANREAASGELLKANGFDISKTQSFTDPAFLFDSDP
ncbi:MAG TPA: polysaccharide pyruvyl transferase family protein, partial [Ginsengibacter sp.]|nr:polysaccharide pyruvyl transferase family protein [Ginsengibacter sp.]